MINVFRVGVYGEFYEVSGYIQRECIEVPPVNNCRTFISGYNHAITIYEMPETLRMALRTTPSYPIHALISPVENEKRGVCGLFWPTGLIGGGTLTFMLREDVDMRRTLDEIGRELARATSIHGPFASAHEGISVIREEFEELWDEVKKRKPDLKKMRAEAIQVGAMAARFVGDVCDKTQ